MLPKFRSMLKPGCSILDVGKSQSWNYRDQFKAFDYKTVDINPAAGADIVANMQTPPNSINSVDALICNGVTEQCDNPFQLLRGIFSVMRPDGIVLLGVISTAYPVYLSQDYFRFTESGLKKVLEGMNTKIIEWETVKRADAVSYIYAICK